MTPRALLFLAIAPLSFVAPACSSSSAATVPDPSAGDAAVPEDASAQADTSPPTPGPEKPTAKDPTALPKVTGTCPALTPGRVTFAPNGVAPRAVELSLSDAAKTKDGPVLFYWHGTGGEPGEAVDAFSSAVVKQIVDAGGIVAAPYHDDAAGQLPWFLSLGGSREDDLRVMDEVLACAIRDLGIDSHRVYSAGFSAGAMNTMHVAARRSGYIASIVAFSGSYLGATAPQEPANLYPAMLFHGGPSDKVVIGFEEGAKAYKTKMTEAGHFVFLCNHDDGHTIPFDGRASAWKFLEDHPYGKRPEPYREALPQGFPRYCEL